MDIVQEIYAGACIVSELCRCYALHWADVDIVQVGEWVAGNGSKSGLHEVFMGCCKERGKPAYLARLTACI